MAKGTLNLVFHGFHIFGGVEKGASILAVAPKVDSHVYLAGAWMDECPVEGDYEVTIPGWKAPGQPANFDARCLAVDTPVCKIPLQFLRYSVKVPQPSQIFTEAFAQLQENDFQWNANAPTAKTTGDRLSSVIVFVYRDIPELEDVRVGKLGTPGNQRLEEFKLGRRHFVNFHFWADSNERESVAEAAATAESVYVGILKADRYPINFPKGRKRSGVDGVTDGEYMSLPERHERFRKQLNLWRSDKALKRRYPGAALMRPSSLDDINESPTCGCLRSGTC
jgi:hypothetical protein